MTRNATIYRPSQNVDTFVLPSNSTRESFGIPYRRSVLDDSPIFYYVLNEASGSTVTDYSGSSLNGTVVGTINRTADAAASGLPRSYKNMTTGSYVNSNITTNYVSAVTLEIWAKADSMPSGNSPYLFTKNGFFAASHADFPIAITLSTTTLQAIFSIGNDYSADAVITYTIPGGGWYHIVCAFSNSTSFLYVNGVQVGSASTPWNLSSSTRTWCIGRNQFEQSGGVNTGSYYGYFSHAALYSYQLSATRVKAHYDARNS
jgi:hypothetical protein